MLSNNLIKSKQRSQAQSIIDAYEHGQESRAASDDAIVKAARVISAATNKVSTKIIEDQRQVVDELVQKAEMLALPAPPAPPTLIYPLSIDSMLQ